MIEKSERPRNPSDVHTTRIRDSIKAAEKLGIVDTPEVAGLHTFIDRRLKTFEAIGNGQIRPGEPWRQGARGGDGMDATIKVVRAKEAVDGSLLRIEKELDIHMAGEFRGQLGEKRKKLPSIQAGAEKGYIPEDIVDFHTREVTLFEGLPKEFPSIDRGLNDIPQKKGESPRAHLEKKSGPDGREKLSPNDPEFRLPTGEVFYGEHAQLLSLVDGKTTPFIDSDTLMNELWPELVNDGRAPLAYSKLKRVVNQAKVGLHDTDWELVGKQGINGGYTMQQKEDDERDVIPTPRGGTNTPQSGGYDGRSRKHIDDPEYVLPTGENFYGDNATLLKILHESGGTLRADEIASNLWPSLTTHGRTPDLHNKLITLIRQTRSGLEDSDWEIGSRKGHHGGYHLSRKSIK